jgi:hypothetical protein
MDSNTILIYIPLLDEGTDVARPTLGVPLGDNLHRVLATPTYDANDEHWKFPPGRIVRCLPEMRGGDEVLVAQTLGACPSNRIFLDEERAS